MSGTLLATCSSSTVQKHFRWPQMSGILPRNVRYTQVDLYLNYDVLKCHIRIHDL